MRSEKILFEKKKGKKATHLGAVLFNVMFKIYKKVIIIMIVVHCRHL